MGKNTKKNVFGTIAVMAITALYHLGFKRTTELSSTSDTTSYGESASNILVDSNSIVDLQRHMDHGTLCSSNNCDVGMTFLHHCCPSHNRV